MRAEKTVETTTIITPSCNGGLAAALCACLLLCAPSAHAENTKETDLGWHGSGELAIAWLGGNSESRTTSVAVSLRRVWEQSALHLDMGGTLTDAALTTRTAVGTPGDFELKEETREEKTAEYYYARGRYDHRFNARLFAFGGMDWFNNRFAGIQSRFLLVLGAGKSWLQDDEFTLRTDAGFTYTFQDDVIKNPFVSSTFPGLRFSLDSRGQLTESTEFRSLLVADWNVEERADVRLNWTSSLPVAISGLLSLKPSLQLLWRNRPSLTEVALEAPDGTATGEKVLVPLQKLDTKFVVALVAEF
jgi:putative salt-induced outer membrane protein YdiY